ncbi:unnamed protein product [Cladocopium goreaui]|uniref:Mitochondrial splicing suppressor 51-like C-terminal domain-containing protein n=1 Tax=Cladocopium goreaui TaxID=2562237 RepID=A0A9P1CGR2_9DINO|nr:unnamed protein product [Cladocopium goreaui]
MSEISMAGVSVGCRVRLINLQKSDLNGCTAVVVSLGDRVAVELENDQRIAVRPQNLEVLEADGELDELAVGSRVMIRGLQNRPDLNSRHGTIVSPKTSNGRWGVGIGPQKLAISESNLLQLPCPPHLGAPATRASLHRQDLILLHLAARSPDPSSIAMAEDRAELQAACCLRQKLLFTWGVLPSDPRSCVNLALAPTLVFGMLAAGLELREADLKVHCIGATPDFEGCADWSGLGELLAAAGFIRPRVVEITYFGNQDNFVLPQGVRTWSMMQKSTRSTAPKVRIRQFDELYHAKERETPDVALLCHPGFDNYKELWHPTLGILFRLNVPLIVAGHTNFLVPTHDALAHQDLGLIGLGANLLRPQIWNPFCQAYEDRTKGSLLATPGQEHNHCNLGLISICRGGDLKPFEEVEAFFEVVDYVAVSTQGFLPFEALGPQLQSTFLRLKYPHMSDAARAAAVQLLRDLTQGTLQCRSAGELVTLLEQRGVGQHYARGRGNW